MRVFGWTGTRGRSPRALLPTWLTTLLAVVTAAGLLGMMPAPGIAAAADKPAEFMESFAREAIRAQNSGSPDRMMHVIRRYADLTGIGYLSLGEFADQMPNAQRTAYQRGMSRFMAYFAIHASKKYRIAKAEVFRPSKKNVRGHEVSTRVVLTDGSVYDVTWQLTVRSGRLKILDANVWGFWMTPFQRDEFVRFVRKNNGNLDALVLALENYGG